MKQKGMMSRRNKSFFIGGVVVVIAVFLYFGGTKLFSFSYDNGVASVVATSVEVTNPDDGPKVVHLKTPESFKAIYMTQCVAGTPSFRDKLIKLIDDTELNSVIIDVKDFSGKLGFDTDNPKLSGSVSDECGAYDMQELLARMHEKGIYTVGRITVFQDPFYATEVRSDLAVKKSSDGSVWTDYKGLSFIDVGATDFWDYIVEISKESYALGFDELNFDYVRFPSDGNMRDIHFPFSEETIVGDPDDGKAEILENFFAYLQKELSNPENFEGDGVPVTSADLFGMTMTNKDDLNIGQVLERSLPYFDYIMPMVYPSHYPKGFNNWPLPATVPYEIIKFSMDAGVRRALAMQNTYDSTSTSTAVVLLREQAKKGHGNISPSQLRPWLQDFDLGATYTPEMVRAQMQATYDAGLTSWAMWDAGNTYTRSALNLSPQPE